MIRTNQFKIKAQFNYFYKYNNSTILDCNSNYIYKSNNHQINYEILKSFFIIYKQSIIHIIIIVINSSYDFYKYVVILYMI